MPDDRWTRGWIDADQECDVCLGSIHKDSKGWRSTQRGGIFHHDECHAQYLDRIEAEALGPGNTAGGHEHWG